jgi:hypothetical protein
MEIYNQLKTTKSINTDDFIRMIEMFFDYTDADDQDLDETTYHRTGVIMIEENASKRLSLINKYPLIFKTFLLQPAKFAEFLDNIFEPSVQNLDQKFVCRSQDNTIVALICCAVFHLSKIFTMIGDRLTDETNLHLSAAKYYHLPLGKWLSKFISVMPDNSRHYYVTFSDNVLNVTDYLLLMSFVSKELDLKDRPVVKYLSAIKKRWPTQDVRSKKFNIALDYMLWLLIEYEDAFNGPVYSDLFDNELRSLYYKNDYKEDIDIVEKGLINWTYFIDLQDYTQSVFFNARYTLRDFVNDEFLLAEDYYILDKFDDYVDDQTTPFFLMFVYSLGPRILYEVSEANMMIRSWTWNNVLRCIYNIFEETQNIERDVTFILAMLCGKQMITYDLLREEDGRTFVMAILDNSYFQDNAKYIRDLLKALLKRNYSVFKKNAKYYEILKGHETSLLLDKQNNSSVLIKLLVRLELIRTDAARLPTLDIQRSMFRDRFQSIAHSQGTYSDKSSITEYDTSDHISNFGSIIKDLLELDHKYHMGITPAYIAKLYKYKQALIDKFNINLDDYKFKEVKETPVSLLSNSKRSVLNASTKTFTGPKTNTDENIFKKKVPVLYKKPEFKIIKVATTKNKNEKKIKIGNAVYNPDQVKFIDEDTIQLVDNKYVLENVQFANEKLLKDLLMHYSRTVEGMNKNEYGGSNRIIKIRRYLQNKYQQINVEIVIHVEKDKELDTLLQKWDTISNKSANSLHTKYYIKYYTLVKDDSGNTERLYDDGIDQGGLTKNFFTKCAKQLKSKFFKEAYAGSDRYVLHP